MEVEEVAKILHAFCSPPNANTLTQSGELVTRMVEYFRSKQLQIND